MCLTWRMAHLHHFRVTAHGTLTEQLFGTVHKRRALLDACLCKGVLEPVVAISANLQLYILKRVNQ